MFEPIMMTKAEAAVVDLLFQGRDHKAIALELGVAVSTVKQRLHTVYTKAGAQNSLDLLAMSFRNGGFLY